MTGTEQRPDGGRTDDAQAARGGSRPVPSDQDLAFFRTYGYLRLPGLLSAETVDRLREEVVGNLSRAYRMPDAPASEATGYDGFYLPLMGAASPVSRALTSDPVLLGLAERLLESPVVPKPPKGVRYRDTSPWHRDSGDPHLEAVKLVCYLEPLTGADGALRVLPGSHRPEFSAAADRYRKTVAAASPVDEEREARVWPGVVLDTVPGDVLVFDVHLWHASLFGRDRDQWSLSYAARPRTPEATAAVHAYIASFLGAGHTYDREEFPYYDPDWLSPGRPTFATAMSEIGLFDQLRTAD
ncbi:phytanoyl-CoA dioxygenase family protein [Streptomyces sp. PTY087I2]|uniref:phytanoyl-CoA dioxygenase family protein n=1 Tax=Streptomyces sp. PTY087I2 TaxID=1819298 RepID=UPI00080BDACF|nr:phytanoyl-CoA dioxygenase family protein [Streptomyces sp. PTY087I2]OCC10561.1 Phytanoyl-CoA dioxygenase (PhyH) [Streptomyces sp. PTY087I2]